ncbi:M48 family metallopeptidase [candidate division KSB1 bacterium]
MEIITPENLDVPLVFRRSRRARRLRLQMNDKGKFTLVAPWLTSKRTINHFIDEHIRWIEKQIVKVEKQKQLRPDFKYRDGDMFYYFGEPVTLIVRPFDRKRPTVKIHDDQMQIALNRDISKSNGMSAIKKTIEQFYKKKAEEVIHDRLQFFNEHYGFKYNRVTLRNQKSRWGSCSYRKNLNFNWRLIMAPIEVIDYVVVHELCHLKEMNHSARYWKLVSETTPNYKETRKWLRDNHYLLTI